MVNSRYPPQAGRRQGWKRPCFPNWKGEGMLQFIQNNIALSFRRESAIILPFSNASAKALPLPFSFPIPVLSKPFPSLDYHLMEQENTLAVQSWRNALSII
jgi:hypothetical protein